MPFFKELRRRKTGLKTDKTDSPSNGSTDSGGSSGAVAPSKSSSTLNSVYGSSTPPSSIQPNQSTPNLAPSKSQTTMNSLPQRPMPLGGVSNRSSFVVRLSTSSAWTSLEPAGFTLIGGADMSVRRD